MIRDDFTHVYSQDVLGDKIDPRSEELFEMRSNERFFREAKRTYWPQAKRPSRKPSAPWCRWCGYPARHLTISAAGAMLVTMSEPDPASRSSSTPTPAVRTQRRQQEAIAQLDESFEWYRKQSKKARIRFSVLEVLIVVASMGVVALGILIPHDARPAGLLGAAVTALAGIRSIFHWNDNWKRFMLACITLSGLKRLYEHGAPPFDVDDDLADQILVAAINDVELTESKAWSILPGPERAHAKA